MDPNLNYLDFTESIQPRMSFLVSVGTYTETYTGTYTGTYLGTYTGIYIGTYTGTYTSCTSTTVAFSNGPLSPQNSTQIQGGGVRSSKSFMSSDITATACKGIDPR